LSRVLVAPAQVASFLEIVPDARAASLGGASLATEPDAWAAAGHHAKLASRALPFALAYTYSPVINKTFPGSRMHAAAARVPLGKRGAMTVAFKRVSLGELLVERVDGEVILKPADMSVDLGYARLLAAGLAAGASIRYIVSDLGEEGTTVGRGAALNASVCYRREFSGRGASWTVGAAATNIGPGISYGGDSRGSLPARVTAAAAIRLPLHANHDARCTVEYSYRFAPRGERAREVMTGVEQVLYGACSLRLGYHRGNTGSGPAEFISAGCGARAYGLAVDFSYQRATRAAAALDKIARLSISLTPGMFNNK
jgi:hypothetical protein